MMIRSLLTTTLILTVQPVMASSFETFLEKTKPLALQSGVSARTYAKATSGLKPDERIDRFTKRQPELVKPIGGYITRRVEGPLAKSGRRHARKMSRLLRQIEQKFGVDPYVVAAIWGMETAYGSGIGTSNAIRSLATLGWKKYRGDFFQKELVDALLIMQEENLRRSDMVSSWAGAMGQTQLIPSSFRKFAVDFDKNGKRDLWRQKGDALASTANYLKQKGWIAGQPWGFAVKLPSSLPKMAFTQTWQDWASNGVRARSGKPFPKKGEATLFFPAGHEGPAFLISPNYEVIRDYNSSDAYSLSVGLLSNRLRGQKNTPMQWPKDKTLNKEQRMRVQSLLLKKGFDVPNRTGRIIKGVRSAIRDYQVTIGAVADGYPDLELLRQLAR